jgi:flavin-dependent dehydrogenase
MIEKSHKVLVVGAGPAGATFSKLAAHLGLDVALCDFGFSRVPGEEPSIEYAREKPCGGVVDNFILENFKIPEIAKYNGRDYRVIDGYIKNYCFISPDGDIAIDYPPRNCDAVVRRSVFDWYNLSLAREEKNVKFYPNRVTHVEETDEGFMNTLDDGRKILAEYEVGADGVFSRVRKDIFWKVDTSNYCIVNVNFWHMKRNEVAKNFDNTMTFYFSRKLGIGYAFSVPSPDLDYIRIGAGQKRENISELKKVLTECMVDMAALPQFRGRLSNPIEVKNLGYATPFGNSVNFFDTHPCSGWTEPPFSKVKEIANNKILLGEAAFHNSYLTFEGIRPAMIDAELAAETLDRKKSFEEFDSKWRESPQGQEIVKPMRQIGDFYNKDKLSELFKLAKETERPELIALAFRGHIRVRKPDIALSEAERTALEDPSKI